ncbi:RbsD/FucU domain-containing protein, partial [Escherichia coli]|uniref:RbsD/FucU domain-containing protein n=1 Tax=Escherichia coli TaxID=562 RepID=UPI0024BC8C46
MKKGTVLNSDISSVISRLGHIPTMVVCAAGVHTTNHTTPVDIALTPCENVYKQAYGRVSNDMHAEARLY